MLIGAGFGCSFPPAMNTATRGVEFKDAGVASAMVNTLQQIGSIGIALLSAFAAQSTSRYLASHINEARTVAVVNLATTSGYTVAFAISAAVLAAAGLLCGALMPQHLSPAVSTAFRASRKRRFRLS